MNTISCKSHSRKSISAPRRQNERNHFPISLLRQKKKKKEHDRIKRKIVDNEIRSSLERFSRRKNRRLSRGEATQLARKSSTRNPAASASGVARACCRSHRPLYRDAGGGEGGRGGGGGENACTDRSRPPRFRTGTGGIRLIRPSRNRRGRFFSTQRWNTSIGRRRTGGQQNLAETSKNEHPNERLGGRS